MNNRYIFLHCVSSFSVNSTLSCVVFILLF